MTLHVYGLFMVLLTNLALQQPLLFGNEHKGLSDKFKKIYIFALTLDQFQTCM